MKDSMEEFMSDVAYLYDSISHPCSKKRIQYYNNIINTYFPTGKINILDLGCCTGETALGIYDSRLSIKGIDIAEGMVDVANQKNDIQCKTVIFETMDMRDLKYGNGEFNVVYSNSLEWINSLDELEPVVAGCARCTDESGIILLDFPNADSFIKECRPFYSLCSYVENGVVYKITRFNDEIETELRSSQTYVHLDYEDMTQYIFTGNLSWRLHRFHEFETLLQKYGFHLCQKAADYQTDKENGSFVQLAFKRRGLAL